MDNTQDNKTTQDISTPEQIAKSLFNYAIDREDIKWLLSHLPKDYKIQAHTLEYELNMLKIISVGWCIPFCMLDHPLKNTIAELYWGHIQSFSETISSTTEATIGKKINYFTVLKERLDTYIQAMTKVTEDTDPLNIIGPEFAGFCGDKDDPFSILTGSKLFATTLLQIKKFLEGIKAFPK